MQLLCPHLDAVSMPPHPINPATDRKLLGHDPYHGKQQCHRQARAREPKW